MWYIISMNKFAECAAKNTPTNVRVVKLRKSLTGRAFCRPGDEEFGKMCAPKPVTRKSLYIFLHECAHFALHSDGKRRKRYLEEMEAEQWAHQKMRESEIPVPRSMTTRAKNYVRRKVRQAKSRGAKKVPYKVLNFIRS